MELPLFFLVGGKSKTKWRIRVLARLALDNGVDSLVALSAVLPFEEDPDSS